MMSDVQCNVRAFLRIDRSRSQPRFQRFAVDETVRDRGSHKAAILFPTGDVLRNQ
ncbi:MAG: hypothetical protein NVS3B20_13290 [Polyangiales bacterium]